jgi:hypothetical protein
MRLTAHEPRPRIPLLIPPLQLKPKTLDLLLHSSTKALFGIVSALINLVYLVKQVIMYSKKSRRWSYKPLKVI